MTETAPIVSVLDADHVKEKAGSIGRAVFHVEARIVDDADKDSRTDEVGELVLRGPNVFAGYWGLPEATAEAFRGGWFHTGDLGRIDAEGFITLVDRKKDMIITGGENVYPIEVEETLAAHPAVREAAVVGVDDEKFGQRLAAYVVLEHPAGADADVGADDLRAHVKAQLAGYKVPRDVVFLDELPRNDSGKIMKRELS